MKLATLCSWAVPAVFGGTENYMLVCNQLLRVLFYVIVGKTNTKVEFLYILASAPKS